MTVVLASVGALACSCANYTKPQVAPTAKTPSERNFDALWQGSLQVLRKHRFEIDRRDPRAGVITTRKMLARHWFEFWRPDAVSGEDLAEGTLQTVYRQATVRISPSPDKQGQFVARVEVRVFRPQQIGQEIIAAGEAYDTFLNTAEESDYERSRRQRDLADSLRKSSAAGNQPKAPDIAETRQDNLARKLTAEIRAAADKQLARGA